MIVGTTGAKSGVWIASRFAYAAGITGTLANIFLIAFFTFRFSGLGGGDMFGPANDLVGSLASAFTVPVVLALSAWLPGRRLGWISKLLGLSALAILTVGGPLLVLGALSFEVQAPIMTTAWLVLCIWLFLVNRWLHSAAVLALRVTLLGKILGAGTAAGIAAVGVGSFCPACRDHS